MTAYRLDKTPIHIGPGTAATPIDGFEFTGEGFGAEPMFRLKPVAGV